MKERIVKEVEEYLQMFPEETKKLERLNNFLRTTPEDKIGDWNYFEGHLVSSAFVYAKKEQKFLVLYHKDFQTYVYPGGHMDKEDATPLETAKREVKEETGITKVQEYSFGEDKEVPIDINIHNERLNLPSHLHFDFRYFFVIEKIEEVTLDHESRDYQWIEVGELFNRHFNIDKEKLEKLISEVNEV